MESIEELEELKVRYEKVKKEIKEREERLIEARTKYAYLMEERTKLLNSLKESGIESEENLEERINSLSSEISQKLAEIEEELSK